MKLKVKLGDGKEVQVERKGTIAIETSQGNVKLIHKAQYVPTLTHNLLGVGQLLSSGYSVMFEGETCIIKDKNTRVQLANVQILRNIMFPFRNLQCGNIWTQYE